jgi:transcriptional regulator with XRE-family HTH domain
MEMALSAPERFTKVVSKNGGLKSVAEVLGVSMGFVSMLKNGKRVPSGQVAAEIQRQYGIPAALWFEAA